jgi:class 3 adenylate cyclase/GAF domain-containing protein
VTERASSLVTIFFTDLVGSNELLVRAGEEEAQRVFRAHHDLLAEAAAAHRGEEVKWLGDGLVVAFASAADAVECAIAMQQAVQQPIHSQRLAVRVGLNAGEALRQEADYFRQPVVVARRLCDRAEAGQILCTDLVARPLARRFAFVGLGALQLQGVPDPVAAYEVRSGRPGLPSEVPLVGREAELRRLLERWTAAAASRGGLVLLAGEAGIGKTRLAEELAERAAREGAGVFWGHCFEGEWVPPYAPFAEALEALASKADAEELQVDLGAGGPALAQLVPALRKVLPGLPDAVPLQSDEERFRLLDGVAQLLLARSARTPMLLGLDDLHWADRGTVAMIRHLARFAPRHRLLVVGTYRDVEIDRSHPLAQAFGALHQETDYELIELKGLPTPAVGELLASLAEHEVPEEVAAAIASETYGNPFFVLELVRHLVEEGKLYRGPDGRWTSDRPVWELDIPRSVREVIAHRLARLSDEANRLLSAACAFEGPFRFEVVASLAGVPEDSALQAVDEALAAQVLESAEGPDVYAFTHEPIRQTVYGELSPSRQARLHRRVAEALEAAYPQSTPAQAGEIAAQYQRSAGLPGAERGVEFAVVAATHAETTGAHDDAARFLRTALELLPEGDDRRARLLGRLGISLAWAATVDEAVEAASEAGAAIAAAEGEEAAADYFSEAITSCLENLDRLAAVDATGLLDAPPRPELDELTSQAAKRLGTPVALMTLVDNHRQFFASRYGLQRELAEQVTPLEYSYCKFVAALDEPFRVNNSLTHVLVRDNPIATIARSYLGVPLRSRDGHAIGSLCVLDTSPREWGPEDRRVLEELAEQAMALADRPQGG